MLFPREQHSLLQTPPSQKQEQQRAVDPSFTHGEMVCTMTRPPAPGTEGTFLQARSAQVPAEASDCCGGGPSPALTLPPRDYARDVGAGPAGFGRHQHPGPELGQRLHRLCHDHLCQRRATGSCTPETQLSPCVARTQVALVVVAGKRLAPGSLGLSTETGLSLLSYQLCSYQETRTVQRVEAVQTFHVTYVACGGWILWRQCPKTIYRTQYLTVEVPESRNVTDCCEGYEQLGLYCVLPLNRSTAFASRPGICPTAALEAPVSPCSLDADCPGLQKCCPRSGGHHCVVPAPQDAGAEAEGHPMSWYNVTVRVKVDVEDLRRVDRELRNHARPLCSLAGTVSRTPPGEAAPGPGVASALQPLDSTVHYLDSAGGVTSSTVSRLLLGLPQPLAVANVSAMLDNIVKRVCEVIGIQVQDVDECAYSGLHACSGGQRCLNLQGSYQCIGSQEPASPPQLLNHTGEDCPPIRDHMALNVSSSGFQVSWSVSPPWSHDFLVQVYQGEQLLQSVWTGGLALQVSGLDAGELYMVRTSYQGCGANISSALTIKTDARVFEVIVRITNCNLTEQLLDSSGEERRNFSQRLLREVEDAFSPAVSDLHRKGRLRLEIMSLQAGSVVATLRVTVQDPESPVGISTLAPMLQLLRASTMFQIDPQGTRVQDRDECAHSSEHDCSPTAHCINLEGSYTCQCRTARDANPARPGRACEAAGVTAPALSTGPTALVQEPPTLSFSTRNSGGTPTAAQFQTPGTLPKRGAGGTVGQDRDSTGPSQEEEGPSVAPGPGVAGEVASPVFSPTAPGPSPGSSQGTTGGPVHSPGQFLENVTTEPPTLPAPTNSPTGHVEWHPSCPTQGVSLHSTALWHEDPGPSPFQDSPLVPTPVALETPACAHSLHPALHHVRDCPPSELLSVPVPIRKVTVSNVTGTSFHLAWAADVTLHPTFHLATTAPQKPTVGLETQDHSAKLSGLEPGVLYLVEIMAKVCGKEGARTQLKVRTAAQKLSGKVRIANVRYSESFLNASSEKYQGFLDLFSRTVRDSLPAALRQHMDAGGIGMSITSITNGSVVVEFDPLITVAVDVGEVSATFLDALGNMSPLEVVRSDIFIWGRRRPCSSAAQRIGAPATEPAMRMQLALTDYDECERGEDDCVPGTSCRNTLGSFTCSCEGGAPDSHVEYSGRACAGGSPDTSTPTPGPEQHPAQTGTSATLLPATSPEPQGPPLRLNLTGAVRVLCEIERVGIAIQKRFLQQEAIPASSLYLGQPSCNASPSNGSHVLLAAGWGECGTLVQSNKTSTVVKTVLRNDWSLDGVIHHPTILSPIRCVFRNDLLTSLGYTPKWGAYTVMEDLHGAGTFVTEMQLFIRDSPIPQNYSVSASDDVKIQVRLDGQKSSLKVVLMECWATPSSDAQDPVTFEFINNSCPIPNTYTSLIQNGDSSKAQFKLRIFSFINNSIVYLHCKLRVCMESPGTSCKVVSVGAPWNCNDFRFLRSNEGSKVLETSWGPLIRSEGVSAGASPSAKAHLATSYVALIAVTALAVVAGAVTLLILRYQRTTGKYNFRMQPGSFGYQVFSG
ncbi:uromodulin-like 1 [Erethizon dorsatum]